MNSHRRIVCALLGVALCLFAPGHAFCEWLVTVDGQEIETLGPWSQRGRLIVYEDVEGKLSSLRASLVDLETSRARSHDSQAEPANDNPRALVVVSGRPKAAKAPASGEKREERAPLVVTNADVGRGRLGAPRIVMYSAEWCPQCRRARSVLQAAGAKYYERDVDRDPVARMELIEAVGRVAVPLIRFDRNNQEGFDQELNGFSERTILSMVAEQKAFDEALEDKHP